MVIALPTWGDLSSTLQTVFGSWFVVGICSENAPGASWESRWSFRSDWGILGAASTLEFQALPLNLEGRKGHFTNTCSAWSTPNKRHCWFNYIYRNSLQGCNWLVVHQNLCRTDQCDYLSLPEEQTNHATRKVEIKGHITSSDTFPPCNISEMEMQLII